MLGPLAIVYCYIGIEPYYYARQPTLRFLIQSSLLDGDIRPFPFQRHSIGDNIQLNLVISNSDNSNFRLYRGRTLVPAASHCNRWEKALDLSNTAISNARLCRACSVAPHVHGGVVYIEVN